MTKFYTSVERDKDHILVRGYDTNTLEPFYKRDLYQPTLYLRSEGGNSPYTLFGSPDVKLMPYQFNSISHAYRSVSSSESIFYGNARWPVAYVAEHYPNSAEVYDKDLINIAIFDIETKADEGFPNPTDAAYPVISIAMTLSNKPGEIFLWGYKDYDPKKSMYKDKLKIHYMQCDTEYELFESFLNRWRSNYPDAISGWNTQLYDIPYMINRARNIGFNDINKLSPWGVIRERNFSKKTKAFTVKDEQRYYIAGVSDLDYQQLFMKFAYKFIPLSSYRLNHVADIVLGEEKLSYEDAGNLFLLLLTSDGVSYPDKPTDELPEFQRCCKIRDELKRKLEENATEDLEQQYAAAQEKADHECYRIGLEYNIKDVTLLQDLDAKLNLFDLAYYMAYHAGVQVDQIYSHIALWDAIIYNYLRERNIVVPAMDYDRSQDVKKRIVLEGGYVKESLSGKHKDIVSFDFASLYPHVIMMWNMGTDTVVDNAFTDINETKLLEMNEIQVPDPNYTIAASGQFFRKDVNGIFPILLKEMYEERSKTKDEMHDVSQQRETLKEANKDVTELDKREASLYNKQLALKIEMNSLFGAMSNQYFRYYDPRIASAITSSGRFAIRSLEKCVNKYLNELLGTEDEDFVVAGDTDSCYITLEKFMEKIAAGKTISNEKRVEILDQFCDNQLQAVINQEFNRSSKMLNVEQNLLNCKREIIGTSGIFTKKKRYIIDVLNEEGVTYNEPKLIIKGFDAVRSSTPQICRDQLIEGYKIALVNDDPKVIWKFINEFRAEFSSMRVEEVASPRSVSDINKYADPKTIFRKGTPLHVRGALLYNHFVQEHKLVHKYRLITSGEKIKYIYLRVPNALQHNNVIGFPDDVFPYDLNIAHCIDYGTQFEKTFLNPIHHILDYIECSEETQTLMEFFS